MVGGGPSLVQWLTPKWQGSQLALLFDAVLRGIFSVCQAATEWPPVQLIILGWLLYFCTIKYLITSGPALLLVLFNWATGKLSLQTASTDQKVAEDFRTAKQLPKAALLDATGAGSPGGEKLHRLSAAFEFGPSDAVRTPDECFDGLEMVGYPYRPHYFHCHGLRVHYIDEPPTSLGAGSAAAGGAGGTLVLLHGNPTWSFLYRHMVPHLTAAGFRVIAMDMIGFGRSDKLIREDDMTAELQSSTILALLEHLSLTDVTLVVHDWSGIYMLWALPQVPHDRISHLVLLNTALPPHPLIKELGIANALLVSIWMATVALIGRFVPVAAVMRTMVPSMPLPDALGYGTPFPSHMHKAAVVRAPRLGAASILPSRTLASIRTWGLVRLVEGAIPGLSDILDNNERNMLQGQLARNWLRVNWNKPTLLLFGSPDPLFGSVQHLFAEVVFNSTALAHHKPNPVIIQGAGHYLPETRPKEAAQVIIKFLSQVNA